MDKQQVIEEMAAALHGAGFTPWVDNRTEAEVRLAQAAAAFAIAERHFTQPAPTVSAETRESVKNALKASVALWPDSVDILPGTIERWLEVVDGQTVPYWAIHATIRVLRELCTIRGRPLVYEREETANAQTAASILLPAIYKNICDFIARWKKPPKTSSPKSLNMLSDFFLCTGSEMFISQGGNVSVKSVLPKAQQAVSVEDLKPIREALNIAAKAELFDPGTGIIDADVLSVVKDEARKALENVTALESRLKVEPAVPGSSKP